MSADRFFVLSNPILDAYDGFTTPQLTRNVGALLSSRDLYNWDVEKIFIHSANVAYEAVQYFNFEIEGDDLLVASRTAFDVGGNLPPRGHDSNLITFHRIEDFRRAAPDFFLVPDPSNNRVLRWERTQYTPAPLGSFTLGGDFAGSGLDRPARLGQDEAGFVYIEEEGGFFDSTGWAISREWWNRRQFPLFPGNYPYHRRFRGNAHGLDRDPGTGLTLTVGSSGTSRALLTRPLFSEAPWRRRALWRWIGITV